MNIFKFNLEEQYKNVEYLATNFYKYSIKYAQEYGYVKYKTLSISLFFKAKNVDKNILKNASQCSHIDINKFCKTARDSGEINVFPILSTKNNLLSPTFKAERMITLLNEDHEDCIYVVILVYQAPDGHYYTSEELKCYK